MNARTRYPSDLTDLQWDNISLWFPEGDGSKGGRPRKYPAREIVNAVLYLARSGCAWRMLPHDFPPWKTVSLYFYTWRDAGVWEKLHDALRQDVRRLLDREATPSATIVDSQAVKTTESGGPRGYDGGKKNRRPQAARDSGHAGSDLGVGGSAGQRNGLGRGGGAVPPVEEAAAAAGESVGGFGVPGGGVDGLGDAVVPVRGGGRGAAAGGGRLRGATAALDRGADLRLVRAVPPAGEGLRDESKEQRDLDHHRHDSPDVPLRAAGAKSKIRSATAPKAKTEEVEW